MKVGVIGSRSFSDYDELKKTLDTLNISTIVSGGARGADKLAEKYAEEKNIQKQIFLPDWNTHGKKAGFLRNTDIVSNSDLIVCFWDGKSRGTQDSINKAYNMKKNIIIIRFTATSIF